MSDLNPNSSTSRLFRVAISVLIIGHLWAMISRPIEFATLGPFGASPSASLFRVPVRGYSQFAYLDHGYAFFAPDPGPSHLIEATITRADGEQLERRYPDLADQRPRLLYHRHFMLAEFLNDVYHPPGDPAPGVIEDPEALREWHQSRRRYETVRDSMINRMRARHPASQIAIRRLEHRPPGLPEFMEGKVPLDDPRLYRVLFDMPDEQLEYGEADEMIQPIPAPPPVGRSESNSVEAAR